MVKGNPSVELKSNRIDDYFNYTLRDARLKVGYTQGELAKLVGVSNSAICCYERLRAVPEEPVARRIAVLLNERLQKANCIDDYIKELFPESLHEMVYEIRKEREYSPDTSNDTLDYAIPLMEDTGVPLLQEHQIEEAQIFELEKRVQKVLKTLSYREREIIKLRYGLNGDVYSLAEIGKMFKISGQRVSEIEFKAVKKLQQPSRSQELVRFLD